MEILVTRNWRKPDYTIGKLYINGEYICNTLEDTDRGLADTMYESDIKKLKVYGATAIPTGRYLVTWTYSNHFKKNMPLINHVKGFDGIRIHSGNRHQDTLGCILCGYNTIKGLLTDSKKATAIVYEKIYNAIPNEQVWITIK